MFNRPGEPEPDAVFGEFKTVDPDPEPDRPLLHFLRPYLVACGIDAPERRRKDQVSRGNDVLEVPQVVDALREKPYLAVIVPHLAVFSLHGAP
jgi:hypothetical protein